MRRSILVTGGLGFIGSSFIRREIQRGSDVLNLDAHTYAADDSRLEGASVETHTIDVCDERVKQIVAGYAPDVVVHLAAETHVTRSETDPDVFFSTNVEGTRSMLEAASAAGVSTFVHVSTDEVYGPALERPFSEGDKEPGEGAATSAYARSKAIADDLAASYASDMRTLIVRPTNCFGRWQHPEKAIARWTTRALSGARLPVWGDGRQVRDWMFVEDVAAAMSLLIETPDARGVYNIGPGNEAVANLSIAQMVAEAAGTGRDSVYLAAYDRPDHDRRYSVDASRIRALGWTPEVGVAEGIRRTVAWYAEHKQWWQPLVASAEELYADEAERT
jgi:dTDP-glucose 4,6-dehydratase